MKRLTVRNKRLLGCSYFSVRWYFKSICPTLIIVYALEDGKFEVVYE
jgi:hypothetical protein